MPALKAILTADASAFQREMVKTGAISVTAARGIEKAWAAQSIQLESQIIAAKKAGTAFAVYEAELATVNAQLAIMRAETTAVAAAETKVAVAATVAKNATINWRGAIGELIVIFRELGRGNFSRIPGSISILAQRMGLLRFILTPLGGILLAIGGAAFFTWRHIKALNDQLDRTQELFSKGFGNMAKSMQDSTKEAIRDAADFDDWLRKQSETRRTLTDDVDDHIRALREELELQKQLATSKGATRAKLEKMEMDEKKKELAIITEAQLKAAKLYESDTVNVSTAGGAFFGTDAVTRNARLKDIPNQRSGLEEEIKRLASIQLLRQQVPGHTIGPGASFPVAADEVVAVGKKGEEVRVSLDQVNGELQKSRAALKALNEEEDRLTDEQRKTSNALSDYKEKTQKDGHVLADLNKKRGELLDSIALHEKYDPQIAAASGMTLLRGSVNNLQRIGAYTPPAQIAQLDVSRKIHHEIQGLRKDVQKLKGSNFGKGEF